MATPSPSLTRIVWFEASGRRAQQEVSEGRRRALCHPRRRRDELPRRPCLGVKKLCIKTERYTLPVTVIKWNAPHCPRRECSDNPVSAVLTICFGWAGVKNPRFSWRVAPAQPGSWTSNSELFILSRQLPDGLSQIFLISIFKDMSKIYIYFSCF